MGKHRHCKHYIQEHKESIRLKRIIEQLASENAELKKELQYYQNPNSPPSANSLLWKKLKKERREKKKDVNCEQKKLGRKKGHKGVSHSFKPTETIEHKMDRCNVCGLSKINFSHQECRIIVDVPKPEPYTVSLHKINHYLCGKCGSEVKPDVIYQSMETLERTYWR